jgi:hypothetical protein
MSNGSGLFTKQNAAKAHLLQGAGGLAGEVADIRKDLDAELGPLAAITVDELTNLEAAGAADLEAATAVTVAPRTVTSFLAPGLAKLATNPRNLSFTTAGGTPADAPATATITGTYRGKAQSEVVNVPQTATIAMGTKPFSTVTSVVYSAAQGTDATVSIGVGTGAGTAKIPRSRGGGVNLIREVAVGSLVTNGVLTVEGLYTPNTAFDGTRDYAVYYEYNPTTDV